MEITRNVCTSITFKTEILHQIFDTKLSHSRWCRMHQKMILCRHDTEVSQWYKGRRWFDAFGPLYSCQNQRILFEICFVTNCKIGIIEHPQVHLTAALLKITILEHIFDKYRWNKIRQGGRWGWVSAEILIISHHNIMEGNSVSVRSLLFGLVKLVVKFLKINNVNKSVARLCFVHDFVGCLK